MDPSGDMNVYTHKEDIFRNAQVLYSFFRLNQQLVKSDVLLVLGNEDIRTAQHAAQVFLEGWAPLVVVSGREGTGTKGHIGKTEAEIFADTMKALGVPQESIVLEKEATNTGENIQFSQRLFSELGIEPRSVILATKSVMELRAALTFKKQWTNSECVNLTVTSPSLELLEIPNEDIGSIWQVIHYIVETFEKLTTYAEWGFQAPVDIPKSVQQAYFNVIYTLNSGGCAS